MAASSLQPLRGEIWDVRFPSPVGDHPAVVLTTNVLRSRLSAVTVVLVTGAAGPRETHVELDADAGLNLHDLSYANATDIHTVPLGRLRRRRGLLSMVALSQLEDAVRAVLEL